MMASEHDADAMDVSAEAPVVPPASTTVLDFSDLDASIQSFTRRFDHYVQTTIASCDEARLAADAQRTEIQERVRALEREREDTKHAQKELWENVASERDADAKLRASVQNLMAQREALVQRTAGIRKEVSEIRAQMEARKQHKQVQVQRLREQVRRNAPELAQLERLTGCTISPSVRAGTIDFAFSLISRDNPARSAILSLDVSKTQYKVPMYDSILSAATVKALLQELERTGDVYTFLKRARSAMVDSLAREN